MNRNFKILLIVFFSLSSFYSFSQSEGNGIEFSKAKDNFSVDFSMFSYLSDNYRIKLSAGINRICVDRYNNDTSNLSNISVLNAGALVCVTVFGSLAVNAIDKNDHKWKKYVLIPIVGTLGISQLLINSQHNFTLLKTDSLVKNPFNLSIFAKSKLEYFAFQNINWFQYRPALGIEIYKSFTKTKIGFALSIGFEKPIDYIHKDFVYNDIRPFGNILLFYMIN